MSSLNHNISAVEVPIPTLFGAAMSNASTFKGSTIRRPHFTDVFLEWGSTSGMVIVILYFVALFYIIFDYVRLQREERAMKRTNSLLGAPSSDAASSETLERRFLMARETAGISAGLLTPSQPPQPTATTPTYTRTELIQAHGVKHIAVIMDGNRRFGKMKAASKEKQTSDNATTPPSTEESVVEVSTADNFITRSAVYRSSMAFLKAAGMGDKLIGHKAGGEKLFDFARYCIKFDISVLTVYAFSTENWGRPQDEIEILMALFAYFFSQMREESHKNGIYCRFLVGDASRLNPGIVDLMKEVERETRRIPNRKLTLNVCISYGSRLEIAQACQSLATDNTPITEESISSRLMTCLTEHEESEKAIETSSFASVRTQDPDILFRTSGESRLSNFLLYQCAYSEMIFSTKAWPAIVEDDVENLLVEYCCRHRRFGK